ncbi:Eco57I restriction endonuclease [Thiovulum sp. ES]|nr:Eco57I restriction endonuclease [Thiovulum sp. ES]
MEISNRNFLTFSHSASTLSEEKFTQFLKELKNYIKNISGMKLEENGKEYLKALFRSIGYENYKMEAVGNIDLAFFEEEKSPEIFFETKVTNSSEMISDTNFKKKSFAQICYYNHKYRTSSVKHSIITDFEKIYIFKTAEIEKVIKNLFFHKMRKDLKSDEIYKDILEDSDIFPELNFTKIDFSEISTSQIRELEKNIYTKDEELFEFKRKLTAIYKVLSPQNLLELNFGRDMNSLDEKFYKELLHIFGVEERIDSDGIQKILQKKKGNRENGSILELTFNENENLDFETAFELNIIWLNRILFLKLLEARLVFMHQDFQPFMNIETLADFRQLENLFFEIMAKEIPERKGGLEKFSKIPYMNSSLFEKKEIEKENFFIRDLDSNLEIEFAENSVLGSGKEKTLKYLFDFLNSYDFGSNKFSEVAPVDRTLIKSSVLGLIFEKVNGYKDGSHFTPSFITQKLAKDSLDVIPVLDSKIKILDPAVGSGHILVSVMNELMKKTVNLKNEFGKKREIRIENDEIFLSDEVQYISVDGKFPHEATRIQIEMFEAKKRIIEKNLFGVDINFKSVEIARLRLWVELLKWSYYDENGRFTTLPNLDINIKVGNSLVSQFDLKADLEEIGKEKIERLQKLGKEYFHKTGEEKKSVVAQIEEIESTFKTELAKDSKEKKSIRKLLNTFTAKHGNELVSDLSKKYGISESLFDENPKRGYKKDLKPITELHEKIEFLENLKGSFEWRFQFPDVLNSDGNFVGFDLIIANPPYIRQEKIKDLKPYLQKKYEIYNGTADIYTYFFELGLDLLSENGVLSFVTSNKWTRAKYGKDLRKMILEKTKIHRYDDFNGIKMFESATVDTSILSFSRSAVIELISEFQYCKHEMKIIEEMDGFGNMRKKKTYPSKCFDYKMSDLSEESFSFANEKELKIKKKIEKIGTPLKDWDIQINYGIKTGLNDAFIVDSAKKEEILNLCTSSEERTKTEAIFKKLLRGRDIKRYDYKWADLWLIYIPWDFKIDSFPTIKSHLNQFNDKLAKRPEVKSGRYNWYALSRYASDYFQEFEKEKIVWLELTDKNKFTIENKFYSLAGMFLLTGENLKYLLAFLNSKVIGWHFPFICNSSGVGTNQWKKVFVENLHIPKPTEKSERVLRALVEYILFAKENGKNEISELIESVIDVIVFGLYFEDSMKKADCYILDRLFEKLQPLGNFKDLETKREYLKAVENFFNKDSKIQRSLIFSYKLVDEVQIINGK